MARLVIGDLFSYYSMLLCLLLLAGNKSLREKKKYYLVLSQIPFCFFFFNPFQFISLVLLSRGLAITALKYLIFK